MGKVRFNLLRDEMLDYRLAASMPLNKRMLLLTSTSDLVQIVTTNAVGTDVYASWIDNNSGAITPGRTNTQISTATTTTVVGSPASSVQRAIKTLYIRAGATQTVTVRHTDGVTVVQLIACTLAAGEELFYDEASGWKHFSAVGALQIGGPYLPLTGGTITGNLAVTGLMTTGGYQTRAGVGGATTGNQFNIQWNGATADIWIDSVDVGAIAFQSWVGGNYLPLTGGTLTGSLGVTGQVQSNGTGAGFFFADRTGTVPTNWGWYADLGTARLWQTADGDRLSINRAGDLTQSGFYLYQSSGGGTVNSTGGPFLYADANNTVAHLGPNANQDGSHLFLVQAANGRNIGGFRDDGHLVSLDNSNVLLGQGGGGYTVLTDGSGRDSIFLGGTLDSENYYRNSYHRFQNVGGAAGRSDMRVEYDVTRYLAIYDDTQSHIEAQVQLWLNSNGNPTTIGGNLDVTGSMVVNNSITSQGAGAGVIMADRAGGVGNFYLWYGHSTNLYLWRGTDLSFFDAAGQFWCSGAIIIPGGYYYYSYDSGGNLQPILAIPGGGSNLVTLGNAGLNTLITGNSRVFIGNHELPTSDNTLVCGFPGNAWNAVYAYAYPGSSDVRTKTDIDVLPDCLDLVNAIVPRKYKFTNTPENDRDRVRWGFVAQEIEATMQAAGHDFGGVYVGDDDQHSYSLSYNDLIAVLWKSCQELASRVATLEGKP